MAIARDKMGAKARELPGDVHMLKPCPLCGGKAAFERRGTKRQSNIIACTDCGCRVESGDVFGRTMPEDYQWNQRHAA